MSPAMPTASEEEVLQDLRHRHWTPLHNAPQPIDGSAVVAWDDSRAIITGGRKENDEATDSVFIYNKGTMEAEMLPSMLQARSGHAAAIVGSNLFVIGGGEGPTRISMNSIEVLNLNDLLEWKPYPVSLEVARFHCSAVAFNEHEIYIVGGTSGGQILDSVEILNTSTETISQGPPMTVPRVAFAASLVGDAIVVTGGVGRLPASGQMAALQSCEQLAPGSDEQASRWKPLHSMNTGRAGHDGLSYGSCMVVVGGVDSFDMGEDNGFRHYITMTEVWNGATGTWTQLSASLPVQGAIFSSVKLGNDLVCFVGQKDPKVYCLFSPNGLLEHQRHRIRFDELIADEHAEVVIPLLLEGLGKRGWLSLFYECIRETNGRLIPRRMRSALGRRSRAENH
jgi:hypothetical protein